MKNVRKNNKKKDKTYKNTCFFVFLLTESFSPLYSIMYLSTEFWSIGVIFVRNLRARCSQ